MYCTTAKLSSKKQKNSLFTKKKSLVGLAPGGNLIEVLWFKKRLNAPSEIEELFCLFKDKIKLDRFMIS